MSLTLALQMNQAQVHSKSSFILVMCSNDYITITHKVCMMTYVSKKYCTGGRSSTQEYKNSCYTWDLSFVNKVISRRSSIIFYGVICDITWTCFLKSVFRKQKTEICVLHVVAASLLFMSSQISSKNPHVVIAKCSVC